MISSELKIISFNCQGLRDTKKRIDVINYLSNIGADIICLQDTHWLTADKKIIQKLWPGDCLLNGSKTNSRGVAILIGKTFEYSTSSVKTDNIGNYISVFISTSAFTFQLINIYAPNTDTPAFFDYIKDEIESSDHEYSIICGDFNLVLNPQKDCYNYRNLNNPRARNCLIQTMDSLLLSDAFRTLNGDLIRYTWHRKNPIRQARLDYFIVWNSFIDLISKCSIQPGYRSDHSIIAMHVIICTFKKGNGLWKFNCSLLKNKDYLILINNLIDSEKLRYALPVYNPNSITQIPDSLINFTISDSHFLEVLLLQIRGETIKFAAALKKKNLKMENELIKEIEFLENQPQCQIGVILQEKKKTLENMRQENLKGLMIRSRAEWLYESEKPSRYFCSLEKRYYTEKTIKKLVTDDGNILSDQKEILAEVKHFYQDLFRSRDYQISDEYLSSLKSLPGLVSLSDTDSDLLEGLLNINEIGTALKSMKNKKAPGIDRFPAEFFKVFWCKLKFFILRSLNNGFEMGHFSVSLRQCVISCLPKGDKPRQFLKNWRPISLLSVVYKIASTALSARLRTVLDKIISKTQSGFVSGRSICENIRLIYDIMNYAKEKDIPGLLMLVDFQKAFDSVSWKFLQCALKAFGFKNNFCKWITILNTNVMASVLQCGVLSEFFNIERGCRQGDPIAAYLFLICGQIMYLLLMNNKDLKGIQVNKFEHKITQFADDTTLILDGSRNSLIAALNTLEIFGSISGLKVNTDKTTLVWIGKKRYSKDKIHVDKSLVWGANLFSPLGIKFSVDLDKMPDLNYTPVIESIKRLLHVWKQRHLTPIGKICVIKTLALSKLNHILLSIPAPGRLQLKELETIFYKFIWDGKPDKIKRSTMSKHYYNGGLKMIELSNYICGLKATWMRRVYRNINAPWVNVSFPRSSLLDNIFTFGSDYIKLTARKTTNKFWAEVLTSWCNVVSKIPLKNNTDALCEPLWQNPNISKAQLVLPHWSKKGVQIPADLIYENGEFLTLSSLERFFNLKTNFLEYHRVISCVKKYLAKLNFAPACNYKPNFPNMHRLILKSEKGSKDFYQILQTSGADNNTMLQSYWEQVFRREIPNDMWVKIFKITFNTIKDNDFIWMQYRILYRILGTNDYLYKLKIIPDGICNLCKKCPQTILHLFAKCEKVEVFWAELKAYIKSRTSLDIPINDFDIIFGSLSSHSSIPFNTTYLVAKLYIFRASKSDLHLSLKLFFDYFRSIYLEQEYVAKLESKQDNFVKIWASFNSVFSQLNT